MTKKILISIAIIIVIFAGLAGIRALQIKSMIDSGANAGAYPETVQVKPVQSDNWEVRLNAIGSIQAIQGTMVRTEAEGIIQSIHFNPGSTVSKGDLLIRLDDAEEQARYESQVASKKLAELTLDRTRELFERKSVSQSELDAAEADFESALAEMNNAKAALDKKRVVAPFSGRLGVKLISEGEFLNRGSAVVSLQSLQSVFVNFSIPQQDLSFANTGYEVRVRTSAFPEESFNGQITAVDPEINPSTRTLGIQATLANDQERLRPGMYVTLHIIKPETRPVIFVPQTAVLNQTFGDTIFVVQGEPDENGMMTVEQRIVRLGETKGDFIEIASGLEGNEKVVTSGAFKLSDGSLIVHSDKGTVEPKLNPEPQES